LPASLVVPGQNRNVEFDIVIDDRAKVREMFGQVAELDIVIRITHWDLIVP
jgi:hypothetical protein